MGNGDGALGFVGSGRDVPDLFYRVVGRLGGG